MQTIEKCCTDLLELINKKGGHLTIHYHSEKNEWLVACEWGKEAEDSPMVGGAIYAVNEHLLKALNGAIKQLGK